MTLTALFRLLFPLTYRAILSGHPRARNGQFTAK